MCGIAGLFRFAAAVPVLEQASDVVTAMTTSMQHRGPDDAGLWADADGRCVLGHRRLSIIDTSAAGHQPMSDASGRWMIVFNGELYNFQELRPAVAAQIPLSGRTDTEVLLGAIAAWGIDALPKFDGMFAFAAFDRMTASLLLARDPFGEKPLYTMDLPGGGLAFASELQALERVPTFDGRVSIDAVAELLSFQYIGAPRSIYQSIRKLPPGHWMRIDADGRRETGSYFAFRPGGTGFDDRPQEALVDELEELLVTSTRRRLIADVPLGAFLSGGVDSSTVCALVRHRLGLPLKTFSVGFAGAVESEHDAARQFAAHLGTEHHEHIVAPHASEFLHRIGGLLDEPNADSSCLPTYLLSGFTRTMVTVAVSGDGGDELFGGYGRYFTTLDEATRSPLGTKQSGAAYYSNRILVSTEDHLAELFGELPAAFAEHLSRLRRSIDDGVTPLHCRLRQTDVDYYMPGAVLAKVDRMSMQHSLEVRTPFLNADVARFAERLPQSQLIVGQQGKRLLRALAYRHLPRELIDRPKQGFGLPMSQWGRDELLAVATDLLEADDSRLAASLGRPAIERFLKRQRSRNGFSTYQVWAMATLESWLRHHPAVLPAWSERSAVRMTAARVDSPVLVGIGERGYVLTEAQDPDHCLDAPTIGDAAMARALGIARACGLSTPARPRRGGSGDALALPGRSALESIDRRTATRLAGAHIIVEDRDIAQRWITPARVSALRKCGVLAIAYPYPDDTPGRLVCVRINQAHPLARWTRKRQIRRNTVAVWAAESAQRVDSNCFSHGFDWPESPSETELLGDFYLFNGLRQLPPLPSSHAAIAERGGGRYSVWSNTCYFSTPDNLPPRGIYRLVRRTENNEAMSDFLANIVDRTAFADAELRTAIAAQLRSAGPAHRPLKPGGRVAVVTHSLPPGGAERQWCYLAVGLKEAGYDVQVLCTEALEGSNAHYLPLLKAAGIPALECTEVDADDAAAVAFGGDHATLYLERERQPLGADVLRLAALMKALRPDAIFAQLDSPNIASAIAAHLVDVPVVVLSFRNYNPDRFGYLRNDWYRACYQSLARSSRVRFSGNSSLANDDYADWIGIDRGAVRRIPNCIEAADVAGNGDAAVVALRHVLGLSVETPVILGVFRLSEEKDPRGFVEVCERVRRRMPALRAFIVGEGMMEVELRQYIASLGLEGAITLLGRRHDIPDLMRIASLLVLSSRFEGMPNVAMEAQLIGVPVVGTIAGGTPDVVVDGVTGCLRPVGDVDGLAEACVDILGDERLRARLANAAGEHARSHFSRAQMVERYVALAAESARTMELAPA